jgi:hypothetical protein
MTANPMPNAISVVVTICRQTRNDLIVSFQTVNLHSARPGRRVYASHANNKAASAIDGGSGTFLIGEQMPTSRFRRAIHCVSSSFVAAAARYFEGVRRPVDGNRALGVRAAFTVRTLAASKIPQDRFRGEFGR